MARRKLVLARDSKGTLFMMEADDFRLKDPGTYGYEVLGDAAYDHRSRTLTCGGRSYRVHHDWSVSP